MEMSTGFNTSGMFPLLLSIDFKFMTFQERTEHSCVLNVPFHILHSTLYKFSPYVATYLQAIIIHCNAVAKIVRKFFTVSVCVMGSEAICALIEHCINDSNHCSVHSIHNYVFIVSCFLFLQHNR
jgi:hypothetical protein